MSLAKFYDSQSQKDHYLLRSRPTLINRTGLKSLVAFDDRFQVVTDLLNRDIKTGFKVLDYGCGDGVYESLLSKKTSISSKFYAVDISGEQLKKAKDLFFETSLISEDNPKTKYPDGYFDLIICSEVLEHVFSPENIISELHRVLKIGGILILTVPNYGSLQIRLSSLFTGRSPMVNYPRNLEHIRFYSVDDIKQLISKY
ncbi:MAG: class I SAM-dependent methyltransferase, partial [Patescibacteria group bacterium]